MPIALIYSATESVVQSVANKHMFKKHNRLEPLDKTNNDLEQESQTHVKYPNLPPLGYSETGSQSGGQHHMDSEDPRVPTPSDRESTVVILDKNVRVSVAGNPRKPPTTNNVMAAAGTNGQHNANQGQLKFFDYNFHSIKKGVSSALLDVSLLMANASQLKSVLTVGPEAQFYHVLLALLIVSISLQVVVGIVLIVLSRININDPDEKKHDQAEVLNNIVVIAIFLMTLVNVFIASLGIGRKEPLQV